MIEKNKSRGKLLLALFVVSAAFLICWFILNQGEEKKNTGYADLYVVVNDTVANTKVYAQEVEEQWYLFLPSGVEDTFVLYGLPEGSADVNLAELEEEDGVYLYSCSYGELRIMQSSSVASVYLTSDDAENYGKDWVDEDNDHQNRSTGSMVLLEADGSVRMQEGLDMIRVRGNTTAELDKKAYKIKLSNKQDLLNTGNSAKGYALLANAGDTSLIRNKLINDLTAELELEGQVSSEWVDLYYDGEYCGNYLLSELPDIDLTEASADAQEVKNELVNGKLEEDEIEVDQDTNAYGCTYSYVVNATAPDSVDGGYMVELDNAYYEDAASWFCTSTGTYYVVKSPEYCSKEEMLYISELFEAMNRTMHNNGVSPDTGETMEAFLDLDSFAWYWSVQQVSGNLDAFNSSTYFYTLGGDKKIYAGILWDYDAAAGREIDDRDEVKEYYHWQDYMEIYALMDACETYYEENVGSMLSGFVTEKIAEYQEILQDSARMNGVLWNISYEDYQEDVAYVESYLLDKNTTILTVMEEEWPELTLDSEIEVEIYPIVAETFTSLKVLYDAYEDGISLLSATTTETDEYFDADKEYIFTLEFAPNYGGTFVDGVSIVPTSGEVLETIITEEGHLLVTINMGYPIVKNTVYAGIDFDLVYDKDWYLEHYPEVAEEVGTADDDVIKYFVETGIPRGDRGCAEFWVQTYLENYYDEFMAAYGGDYSALVNHYLVGGGYENGFTGEPEDYEKEEEE